MKRTPKAFASRLAPLRNKFSVFATAPSTSSRFPASLVRIPAAKCVADERATHQNSKKNGCQSLGLKFDSRPFSEREFQNEGPL